MSRLPDTGFNVPESITWADGGKEIVEVDTVGNVIIRNPATGAVERQVAGPVSPSSATTITWYEATADQQAEYAAVVVPNTNHVDVVDIATGAISRRLPGGAAVGVAYDGEQLLIQRLSGTFEVRSANGRQLIRWLAGDADATACRSSWRRPRRRGQSRRHRPGLRHRLRPANRAAGGPAGRRLDHRIAFAGNRQHPSPRSKTPTLIRPGLRRSSWDCSPSYWTAVACTTAGHPLTSAEWQEYVGTAGPGIPNQLAC